jgi:hypothetical protein
MEEKIARVKASCGAEAQRQALDEFALKAHKDIVELTPHKTGWTQQHWQIRRDDEKSVTVFNQEPVATYLEEGTKPHLIVPNRKGGLFWNGAPHPFLWVHHPGMAARHIVKKYCDTDGRWRFVAMIQEMIARAKA